MFGPESRRSAGHGVVGFDRDEVGVIGLGYASALIGVQIAPGGPGCALERAEVLFAEERGRVDVEFARKCGRWPLDCLSVCDGLRSVACAAEVR